MNQSFKIGNTEFGAEKIVLEIDVEKSVISRLEIYGNEEIFDEISSDENGEWAWALYPPKLYVLGVPFKKNDGGAIHLEINDAMLESHDIALYLMEHNDLSGILSIRNNEIEISGTVDILGEAFPLAVKVRKE